ncbi:Hypothetical protein RG1141_CH42050 [Neorhizobium galegae bv. officinalis bv. officinalis str. HAMBI 1141]|uniref:Uncharacterized protein n=1 Tax=Neorhizobium galegae bv. officinalis bv. officinalis str. HAMBI 1141 TaxID=1028801 RepID=A0A068TEG4_NEOGA|nr:hypothetical protein [Neorhizobium galegae]CDN56519.1 Hypothetical protein RG1141_CH42050 [Neorhizobium galegae bv. officinalis bv. officinalis str. HAMBI 1141]
MNVISPSASACCSACSPATNDANETALAIACTLGAGDFKGRVASIQALARRSLLSSRREPLRLYLTYTGDALAEVQDLVAKEAECCAFLEFALSHDASKVELVITAPASTADAADELFAHFAPELAEAWA